MASHRGSFIQSQMLTLEKAKHMSIFDDKIMKRLERFASRNSDMVIVANEGSYSIISNRKYKGVSIDGAITVPPIYDNLQLHPLLIAGSVEIEGKKAIIDLYSGELLTDFKYDDIAFEPTQHSIKLYKDGLTGLFSVANKCVVEEPSYSDMNRNGCGRYGWMYSPVDGYIISDRVTGEKTSLGFDIDECFDETHGHIFILKHGKVRMMTADGMEDVYGYRKLLSSIGGRLTLYNSSSGVSAIADIYGILL